jgi:hypothetical protein
VRISTHSAALSASVLCWKSIFQAPSEAARASRLPCSTYPVPVPVRAPRSPPPAQSRATANIVIEQASHSLLAIRLVGAFLSRAHAAAAPFWSAAEIDHNRGVSLSYCFCANSLFCFSLPFVFSFNFALMEFFGFIGIILSFF